VCVRGGAIQDLGTFAEVARRWPRAEVEDLGEVVLMPGLVNAHCHLDYTGMAGMIAPTANFADWIKAMLAVKAQWSYSEYADSWVKGARQLLASGCTTAADIEAVPELLPDAWNATELRVQSFLEMTGVRSGDKPESIFKQTLALLNQLDPRASLSPHALYSTPPALMRRVADWMRESKRPVAIHLAESEAEWNMYQNHSGPLFDWLKGQRPMEDCGGRSPIQQAHQLGLLQPNLLAIHCNYLAAGDAELLAQNGCTVVHCPRSHQYFGHAPFPFEQLAKAGVNIALGTDSLATVVQKSNQPATLDFWQDIRLFASVHSDVPHERLLGMCFSGDTALGLRIGAIEVGFEADLIAVEAASPEEVIANGKVVRRFIAGAEV